MKMIKYGVIALSAAFALASCQTEKEALAEHHFTNKLYINTQTVSEELLVKAGSGDMVRTLNIATALQVEEDLSGVLVADTSLVEQFRMEYFMQEAVALPMSCCAIDNPEMTIMKGSNASASATITFTNLGQLNRNLVYVMPIALKNVTDINVIASKTVVYYVFKGAALINVVCNFTENRAGAKEWKTPEKFTNMRQFTAECLVRQNVAGRLISTIMGTEGGYLLRIGDAGVPDTQLQIACGQNQTNSDMNLTLGRWTHIACVFDNGYTTVYFDGKKVLDRASAGRSSVTWGAYGDDKDEVSGRYFWLSYSYAHDRYLDGEMAEVRIWNRCLSEEEINADTHFYTVDPASEGLAAYWKLDDGAGTVLKDSSPNGNDLTLDKATTWPKVSLPEM